MSGGLSKPRISTPLAVVDCETGTVRRYQKLMVGPVERQLSCTHETEFSDWQNAVTKRSNKLSPEAIAALERFRLNGTSD